MWWLCGTGRAVGSRQRDGERRPRQVVSCLHPPSPDNDHLATGVEPVVAVAAKHGFTAPERSRKLRSMTSLRNRVSIVGTLMVRAHREERQT